MEQEYTLTGESGRSYSYVSILVDVETLEPFLSEWDSVPGNYVFAREEGYSMSILYVGQTSNFKERLMFSHEKRLLAREAGLTHVLVHESQIKAERLQEEQDLIEGCNPPLNRTTEG